MAPPANVTVLTHTRGSVTLAPDLPGESQGLQVRYTDMGGWRCRQHWEEVGRLRALKPTAMQGQEVTFKQPLRIKSPRKQNTQKQVSSARELFAVTE